MLEQSVLPDASLYPPLLPPSAPPPLLPLLIARQYFMVRTESIIFNWPSTHEHLGCFQSFASINKVAMNHLVKHFPFLRMPRKSQDAEWNCFQWQWAYAFVILINAAQLPSRGVVAIYTSTNNVWESVSAHSCHCSVLCYQTFTFLPAWWVKNGSSLGFQFLTFKSFDLHFFCNEWSFFEYWNVICIFFSLYCFSIFLSVFFLRVVSHSLIPKGGRYFMTKVTNISSLVSFRLCLQHLLKSRSVLFCSSFVLWLPYLEVIKGLSRIWF